MITNSARFWRVTVGLLTCLTTVSCVTPLPDNVPPLVESRARDIVAVVEVISTRFYERTGGYGYPMVDEDGEEYFQYASAPPFRVRARVISQLYGPSLDREISFKTHSHSGKKLFTGGNLKLVHLLTDGIVTVARDDHVSDVGRDENGMLITPVDPIEILWLPCGTHALKVPISERTSTKFGGYSEPDPDETQKAYFWLDEKSRKYKYGFPKYPRYAIPIEQLASFLQEKQPEGEDFWCP
jgi:hypothetical protein